MSQLPHNLYRACDVRELDRIAIQEFGIPGIKLMTRAGTVTFEAMRERWPDAENIVVVCGAGNNAGDGYVIARLVKEAGMNITLLTLSDPEQLKGDAKTAWGACKASGVAAKAFDARLIKDADVIVDAVLGTGLDRALQGPWAEAIQSINQSPVPVVAVDIPSGLHADSGYVMGVAVQAALTVTFIGLKQGLYLAQGPDYCGEIVFDGLDVPADVYSRLPSHIQRFDWRDYQTALPPRHKTAHKGDSGHSLLVGGDFGTAGAILMAGEAAVRTGSGLTSVATQAEHVPPLVVSRPEVMWHGVTDAAELDQLIERASVIGIGPGLGQKPWGQELFQVAINSGRPLVLDADALNLLANQPFKHNSWVLTPHPGEAARLLGCSTTDVNQDRLKAVKALQEKYGGVVMLKGAGSLVFDGGESVHLCSGGNPGMAVGGMGDVLTGIITALIAQGLPLSTAACAGVALHAAAGDEAAKAGQRGMLASDLIAELRGLINDTY